ncbi:Predicted kinase, aminoglycoside phosphotransferase (APT) family [Microbacterium sp. cf046]|uniref:phosphotransferase family protein n=1 Tax=Microbacterium sp. cf046 TaxID=1761803 RepID=UPI0008E9B9A2|nr:phosphotransferase family protein [Microbacterium sp. cf046]SFR95035.1 Predicted kinase, aminoglycoside phosphotransferase (APT) family [Microbacterium sp. cf046]
MTESSEDDPPGLNVAGLGEWLERAHPDLVGGLLTAAVIAGGKSNLTYRIDGPRVPLVVRRPPLGHVLSSAHDMRREHRVVSALRGSAVPVPPAVDLVDDTSDSAVTGTPFFVMEFVEGDVLSRPSQNARFSPEALREVGLSLAEVLADLHRVDPEDVGLGDFGRGEGFLERQLRTWHRQYDASRSRELPTLDRLQENLAERMPASARTTLVHGDYRLDNAIVAGAGDSARIAAILDWEMSTIGDPLVDLGMFGLYWNAGALPGAAGALPSAIDPAAGYPSFDELVDAYAERARIAVPDLAWYGAFAAYKLGVIAEGIHYRYRSGETVGAGFDRIGALVEPIAAEGLRRLGAGRH